eukprot:m.47309 g.47309  ORF g.47309 m.47309 type:complete len:559 (+) comp10479_c0_seq2:99-1775(+)
MALQQKTIASGRRKKHGSQFSILFERLLFLIGGGLLVSSFLNYRVHTTQPYQLADLEDVDAIMESIQKMQDDNKAAIIARLKNDGRGLELFPGHVCLDGNPRFGDSIALFKCLWSAHQRFKLGKNGFIHIQLPSSDIHLCIEANETDSSVRLSHCRHENLAQQWIVHNVKGELMQYAMLKNVKTNKCLAPGFKNSDNNSSNAALGYASTIPCHEGDQDAQCSTFAYWFLPRAHQSHLNITAFKQKILPKPPLHPRDTEGRKGKVLCWVLTQPTAHDDKATAVNRTWGQRCDYLLFITSETIDDLPTIVLDLGGPESRAKLWTKTKAAWMYVFKHYLNSADWFVKADDDTYISMDHLKAFLVKYNASEAKFLGRYFAVEGRPARSYYSGGSGIVMSREALRLLGNAVLYDPLTWGKQEKGPEDILTADAMRRIHILPEDTKDSHGRQFFLPLGPGAERNRKFADPSFWFYRWSRDARVGKECCSEKWIAGHYIRYPDMYKLNEAEKTKCVLDANEWPYWKSQHLDTDAFEFNVTQTNRAFLHKQLRNDVAMNRLKMSSN